MPIRFTALPTETVSEIRRTRRDAYGLPVEVYRSDGSVRPCRHCLGHVPEGRDYLILAHRPFATMNPYAETGPIFLCADDCPRALDGPQVPGVLVAPQYILRGYSVEERIVYGTGGVVRTADLATAADRLLHDPAIAFADVRSAANNCFQCRVVRG